MRRRHLAAPAVTVVMLVSACGNDAARGVAVPGAPARTTTVPTTAPPTTAPPTTAAPTTTTTTTTTVATTVPAPTTTAAAPTTVPASTTSVPGPTSTDLVYVPEDEVGTLRYGMEGPRTLQLQKDLIRLNYLPPGADDGLYGPGTAGGVRRFQDAQGLVVDGVAGPITQAALAEAIAALDAPPPTGA